MTTTKELDKAREDLLRIEVTIGKLTHIAIDIKNRIEYLERGIDTEVAFKQP